MCRIPHTCTMRLLVGTDDAVRGASGNFRRLPGRVHTLSECFSVFVGMRGMRRGKEYRHGRRAKAGRRATLWGRRDGTRIVTSIMCYQVAVQGEAKAQVHTAVTP